jgi:hypothetical protein
VSFVFLVLPFAFRLRCNIWRQMLRDGGRGYVALAVAGPQGTVTREVETGCGTDRERNMVAFAEEALKLVRDVMVGKASL